MKTLTNIKADIADAPDLEHSSKPSANTQSTETFTRRLWFSQSLITAENSKGGKVQIPISELWKSIEAADATFTPAAS